MPANLCITPDLGKEDMDPEVSTRMIILSSKANVSESEVVNFLHMLNLPITIKWTCYGAMISGKDEYVRQAIRELRKLDPYGIFTKERGFAPFGGNLPLVRIYDLCIFLGHLEQNLFPL